MEIIVLVYLFFIFLSIYFSFLFLILYFANKNLMLDDKIAEKFPKVSVLIPAWNIQNLIGKAIENIRKVDYPKDRLEIIVIDKGSRDDTAKIAKSYGVRVIRMNVKKGIMNEKAEVLNHGIKHATGKIVAIVDADSAPEKYSFLKMVSKFEDKGVAGVTSAVLVKNQRNFIERMQSIEYAIIAWARKLLEFLGCVYVTPGALSMYRTDLMKKERGFDKNVLTEDIEIAWRLLKRGYIIKMALNAKVFTIVPSTIKKWWHQRVRWHIGGLQTAIKHSNLIGKGKYGLLGLFVTPFFTLSFVVSLAGFGVFSYYLGSKTLGYLMTAFYVYNLKVSPLQAASLSLIPTVFTFFMIMLFVITFMYVICGLNTMDTEKLSLKRLMTAEIYILFYLVCYPVNLLHALWLLAIKKFEW